MPRILRATNAETLLVDDEDYALLYRHHWMPMVTGLDGKTYYGTRIGDNVVYLNRMVFGSITADSGQRGAGPGGLVVSYFDGDPRNNTKSNLVLVDEGVLRHKITRVKRAEHPDELSPP